MQQRYTVLWLAGLVLVACVFVGGLYGILPGPLQSAVDGLTSAFAPKHASKPYLEKFEGTWRLVLGDGAGNAGTDCTGGSATAAVHDGAFEAIVGTPGHTSRKVTGTIAQDGTLSGSITFNVNDSGSIEGAVGGPEGQGTWQDDYGCRGTVTLSKLDPVVDPTIGTLANYTGSITLMRGDTNVSVFPGMPLYAGDVVSAQGGDATLSFGLYPPTVVTVKDGESYTVPNKL